MKRLGKKQVECLRLFQEPGHKGMRFEPTRKGEPWPEMKSLIARGLMWACERRNRYWTINADAGAYSDFAYREWWAGLTGDGILVIQALEGEKADG